MDQLLRYEFHICNFYLDFPNDSAVKNLPTRQGTQVPWVRKIPWRRKWQSTPIFLPAKSQRERSLAGYSPWGHKIFGHNLSTKQQHRNHKILVTIWSVFYWPYSHNCTKYYEKLIHNQQLTILIILKRISFQLYFARDTWNKPWFNPGWYIVNGGMRSQ